MSRLRATPAACALLALAAPLSAQSVPSPYRFFEAGQEVGVFVGTFSPNTGQFGYGPGSGSLFGARYGVEISGPFSLEGVVSWIPTTRDVIDPDREEGDRAVAEAEAELVGVDARLKFSLTGRRTWNRLNPFVFAGGGVLVNTSGTQPEDEQLLSNDRFESGTKLLGSLGGGVRLFLSDRWTVRGDAALLLYKLDTPDGFRTAERGFGPVGEDEWVSASSLSVGLSWRF